MPVNELRSESQRELLQEISELFRLSKLTQESLPRSLNKPNKSIVSHIKAKKLL